MSKKTQQRKKKLNIFKVLFLLLIITMIVVVAQGLLNNNQENFMAIEKEEEVIIPEDSVANIVAVGDTLVHSQVYKDAYDSSTGEYDFSPLFKNITKYFENKTVAVGNLETTFAGSARSLSGYPLFNSPEHLAIDLKELGLDIMTTANNHSLDSRYAGIESTLDFLDEAGLEHTGTSRSEEEQNTILMKDLNGIKTAFLCFTYGTNGNPIPSGKEYCINLIDKELMKSLIDKAKEEGAEAICVSMHWGVEYQTKQNKEQVELADFLLENDVNVILGCHSHVPQPMEMRTVTMEDGTTKTGFVIYSMGNFFSAQKDINTRDTVILNVQIRKNGVTGEITIDQATYAPVYDYDNGQGAKNRYELLDLRGIVEDYEAGEGNWSKAKYDLAKAEIERITKIVGPEIFNQKDESELKSENETVENEVN